MPLTNLIIFAVDKTRLKMEILFDRVNESIFLGISSNTFKLFIMTGNQ